MASAPASTSPQIVQFTPLSSAISPSFWTTLAALKIDRLQLSDEAVEVQAHYGIGKRIKDRSTGEEILLTSGISCDGESINLVEGSSVQRPVPPNAFLAKGTLKNYNTIEDFKNADKTAIFNDVAASMLKAFMTSEDPMDELTRFMALCFSDLKKYKFVHWFAFPSLVGRPSWQFVAGREGQQEQHKGWTRAVDVVGSEQVNLLATEIRERRAQLGGTPNAAFFLIQNSSSVPPSIGNVMDFNYFFTNTTKPEERIVGFIDPSPQLSVPGWPLRNLLTLLAVRFNVKGIRVLCWKDDLATFDAQASRSTIADVCLEDLPNDGKQVVVKGQTLPLSARADDPANPTVVGWERNAAGKLGPKMADLGPLMDPSKLADQAVDLNLKLMRWRILPEINLEKIQTTRCLLLGAGTLGCYVARTLLGWGVRKITLVDNSTVSFSNPVRQPLFDYEDCLGGGKPKAKCAADKLKKIYPGVDSTGIQMSIPMPGHPIAAANVEQAKKDVAALEKLFDTHDVVYLLMDSRESRWLPTLLGATKGKLVLNAALGFDTFLVMRHGAPAQEGKPPRLGCYFCNDVVAPADSLTDRTLDQMCTVTRPGLASLAGASAVELMVSLLQHKDGAWAAASTLPSSLASNSTTAAPASSSCLGLVPHQIRGFLANFNNMLITGPAFDKCTACSQHVVDAYQTGGFDGFLKRAFDDVDSAFLESVTGLDEMKRATELAMQSGDVDWSEDEGEEEGEGELL